MHLTKTLLTTFLTGVVFASAPSLHALEYRHTRASVRELIDPAGSTATWQSLAASIGAGEFKDGLLMLGSAERHEVVTARRFAHVLGRKYGFKLILLSKIFRMTVPAFDGLIINAAGHVVANFSMKRTSYDFNFRDSHAKITNYNQIDQWVTNLVLPQQDEGRELFFRTIEARESFESRVRVMRDLAKVFGVGQDRPTWMLIEFYSGFRLEPWRVAHVAQKAETFNAFVPRVLAIDDEAFYDIKSSRVRSDDLRTCEVFLRMGPFIPRNFRPGWVDATESAP